MSACRVKVPALPEFPATIKAPVLGGLIKTSPVPLGVILISIFESLLPVADKVGPLLFGAFATVNSLVADPVAVNLNNSLEPVSKIDVPIIGVVKVLFVKVCVPVRVTSPKSEVASTILGFVPSSAHA